MFINQMVLFFFGNISCVMTGFWLHVVQIGSRRKGHEVYGYMLPLKMVAVRNFPIRV